MILSLIPYKLHGLPRNTSARELKIQDDIITFNALLRKSMFRFIDRCRKFDNSLIRCMVNSNYFPTMEYFCHCNQPLTMSDSSDWFFKVFFLNEELH